MTCIVGVEHAGEVHVGADSAVSDELNAITIIDQPKAWVAGGVVFGGAGDGRFLNLLRCSLRVPPLPKGRDITAIDRWFARPLASAVRKLWREEAKARGSKENADADIELLVGVYGRVYYVRGTLDFGHLADGFGACGSGADVAIGALEALAPRRKLQPKPRLAVALTAAAKRTAFVAPPFTYVSA